MIVSAPAFYDPMTAVDMMPIPDVVIDPVPAPPFYDPVTSLPPPVPIPVVTIGGGISTKALMIGAAALALYGLSMKG